MRFRNDSNAPVTMLFSFPGSGNTWTRYLIENATGTSTPFTQSPDAPSFTFLNKPVYLLHILAGIYSGALYNDQSLIDAGFIGEGHTGNDVIVVKSHLWGTVDLQPNGTMGQFDKV